MWKHTPYPSLYAVATSYPRPFPHLHLSSTPQRLPSCFKPTATITKMDPMLAYACNVANLSDFDYSEIRRAVLPRIERDYERTLKVFKKLLSSL